MAEHNIHSTTTNINKLCSYNPNPFQTETGINSKRRNQIEKKKTKAKQAIDKIITVFWTRDR